MQISKGTSEPRFWPRDGVQTQKNNLPDAFILTCFSRKQHRRKAIFALSQMGHPDALNTLMSGVGHPNAERRNMLSTALLAFGHAALPPLLGLLGDPAAVPALTEVLLNDTWEVQFAALSALGHLPGEDAELGIAQATRFADPRLRAIAQRLTANRPDSSGVLQERLKQRHHAKGTRTLA